MKKLTGYVLILAFISISFISCNKVETQTNYEKNRIVLVQPYLGNLKSIIYFVENKNIEIPNLELTVVIYAKAKNDYDNIKKFLSKNNYSSISLMKIDGDLNEKNLFQKNPCTDDFQSLFKNSHGMLFFGGDDLPPSVYGQKIKLTTIIENPYRHYFHLSLLFHLLGGYQNNSSEPFLEENPNYIINGFCLGMQSMNVASGGTMYQDIPSDIYGVNYVEDVISLGQDQMHLDYNYLLSINNIDFQLPNFHRIQFIDDQFFVTKLMFSKNDHPFVASAHHQAIKELGKGFKAAAKSMDSKVIEAIVHEEYENVYGVQFHPEIWELYLPNANKHKSSRSNSVTTSYSELLKNENSLRFHEEYWKYFSKLFQKENL